MISAHPGGLTPNRATEFIAPNPLFADGVPPPACAFFTNASMPQIANYALIAGIGFFVASAVTPQGQANAAEYTFGLHAQTIHQAEGAKSSIWRSVPTPPAAAQPVPLRFIWSAPQAIDLTLQGRIQPSADTPPAAVQPSPLRLIFASQEALDLSIGAWVVGGTQALQGPVPPAILTLPQDATQFAAQIWKPQPAVIVITPNPIATFFSMPPQTEDRPTRAVWQSLRAGQTPPVIASFYATPQADPSQIAPQVWSAVATPPAIAGVTVWPAIVVPAQFDTSINPTVVWTLSTFSPGLTPPIPPAPDVVPDVIRNFSLRDWRKWHRPEDERELRKLRLTPAVAEVIAEVAERQAQKLDLDEQQRLEELTRELEIKGLQWRGRYLELLNAQRQQLIDEEIGRLMRQKQAEAQRRDEEAILLLLTII